MYKKKEAILQTSPHPPHTAHPHPHTLTFTQHTGASMSTNNYLVVRISENLPDINLGWAVVLFSILYLESTFFFKGMITLSICLLKECLQ